MKVKQGTEELTAYEEEEISEESLDSEENYEAAEKGLRQKARQKRSKSNNREGDRSSFVHGLSIGLGIGCIATFIIMWITVFFTPQLPQTITYEAMLAIFIYPLIYLLAVGLVALTAGIVREYYARTRL